MLKNLLLRSRQVVAAPGYSTTAIEPQYTGSPVPRLFRCNDTPTEEERVAILGYIEILLAKLDNPKPLAAGIDPRSTHDGSRFQLKAKREHHRKLLDLHRALIQGFRSLPSEILEVIFEDTLEIASSDSRHQQLITLMRVCSSWRLTALHYPRLWSTLPEVDWDRYSSHYRGDGPELKRRALLWLKRTTTIYLEHSGTYPLTFTFRFLSGIDGPLLLEFESLFMALVAQCHRWANVDLHISLAMLTKASRIAGHLPLLRSLSLNMHGLEPPTESIPIFSCCPSLLHVTLQDCWLPEEESKPMVDLPWSQLKTFRISHYSSLGVHTYGKNNMDTDAISSRIDVGRGGRAYLEKQISSLAPSSITELDVEVGRYGDTGPGCIRYITEELTLPSLISLRLSIWPLAMRDDSHTPFSHALPLIRRSGCSLKRLEVAGSGCVWRDSVGALVQILELSDTLEELVYGLIPADALKALVYEVDSTYHRGPLAPKLRRLKMHIPKTVTTDLFSSTIDCAAINATAKSRCRFPTPSSEVVELSLEIHSPSNDVSRHAFHMLENELSPLAPRPFSSLPQDELFKNWNTQLQRVGHTFLYGSVIKPSYYQEAKKINTLLKAMEGYKVENSRAEYILLLKHDIPKLLFRCASTPQDRMPCTSIYRFSERFKALEDKFRCAVLGNKPNQGWIFSEKGNFLEYSVSVTNV